MSKTDRANEGRNEIWEREARERARNARLNEDDFIKMYHGVE